VSKWLKGSIRPRFCTIDGFGHSQRSDALLSRRAMGEFIIRLADAFELDKPHVVAPDIGTGASLFAAA
jgi:hypothetical protein